MEVVRRGTVTPSVVVLVVSRSGTSGTLTAPTSRTTTSVGEPTSPDPSVVVFGKVIVAVVLGG